MDRIEGAQRQIMMLYITGNGLLPSNDMRVTHRQKGDLIYLIKNWVVTDTWPAR
jgi:hypothetical protein